MIDVHSHIIPGVDDGPETFPEAIDMLRLSAESGVTDIIATPHANARYSYDASTVAELAASLQSEIGNLIRIHRGCELNLTFENAERALSKPQQYTLAGGSYLLVEMAEDYVAPAIDDVLNDMVNAGLRPVIAHPERNHAIRHDVRRLRNWVERGCLLQVTAQSLLGDFGSHTKRASERMIELRLAHLIASDTHDALHRPPTLDTCFSYVSTMFDETTADRLLNVNPLRILQNQPVQSIEEPPQLTLVSRFKRRLQRFVTK